MAFDWTMQFEDPLREYKAVPDVGGEAISGINSHSFPEEFAAIAAMPQSQRSDLVCAFYRNHFWNNWLEQLDSQELANRVFDASVNMGQGTAVRLLQTATDILCQATGKYMIVEDGTLGPATVDAANECGKSLVEVFRQVRVQHYEDIAASNPSEVKFLLQWIARAEK